MLFGLNLGDTLFLLGVLFVLYRIVHLLHTEQQMVRAKEQPEKELTIQVTTEVKPKPPDDRPIHEAILLGKGLSERETKTLLKSSPWMYSMDPELLKHAELGVGPPRVGGS